MNLPFHITAAALERLSGVGEVSGMEPGLRRSIRLETRDPAGAVTDVFDGEHYVVGLDRPEIWATDHSAVRMAIEGRGFWLPRDVIAALTGRHLDLLVRHEGPRQPGRIRSVLVSA